MEAAMKGARRKKSTVRRARPRAAKPTGGTYKPVKLSGKAAVEKKKRDGSGPLEWLLPMMETAYTPMTPRGAAAPAASMAIAASSLQPGGGMIASPSPGVWRDLFLEYKRRKAAAPPAAAPGAMAPGAAFVPGARNWLPLGPSVVLDGQTVGQQPVAGRVAQIAVAPGGSVAYAASANGGIFRTSDGGTTWRSMMDRFDLNPTDFASASLVCGAVAIDPLDPNRVYVGTGEGDTLGLFRSRITNALPAYRGVGVIRSDDGGVNWVSEPSSPDLAGEAFFALAVDPGNRENVIGATTQGLYRRMPLPGGKAEWHRVRTGVHSSAVAAAGAGVTRLFCAQWGLDGQVSGVFHSDDNGASWSATGTNFPSAGAGRIALGVQPTNPNLIYAFVATQSGALHGVFRLDGVSQRWKAVNNIPDVLPGGQGVYDLTMAVDPADPDLIYLGGDRMDAPPWGGSVWRCRVAASGAAFRVASSASIGTHAHADVHCVTHTPGNPDELWCTCDGGVFLNRDPRGTGQFVSQNNGLACLCCNFIAQHPTDPNILFTGLQDNGTARTASGPIWSHVSGGDGGYCLVNWATPNHVLIYMNGVVYRSTSGGTSHAGWSPVWDFGWATMTQPIVGLPFDPANPADAKLVAVGAGQLVFVSKDFAGTWPMQFAIPGGGAAGAVFALAFASRTRLFAGTTRGQVYRADLSGGNWLLTRLDTAVAGPLGVEGLISDIAVDPGDPSLQSVYVAFGGMGDQRRVWRFDGTRWQVRSGTGGGNTLLNVEHNALAVDRTAPNNVYVGADIGVWHTSDGGLNWRPLENGLPDAPVFDLQLHSSQRLLRAATHGRGVYEISLT
jgi:photosystem II stability/assembly factor-like uncharacterized protein